MLSQANVHRLIIQSQRSATRVDTETIAVACNNKVPSLALRTFGL